MTDRIIVTVDDEQRARIEQVAAGLRAAGMQIDQVLRHAGVITGSVPAARRGEIERVPGVAAVEDETPFQLAPPDADVQ